MVVGLRPPPRATFPNGNETSRRSRTIQLIDLREPVEDTLCPSGRACPACVKRFRTHWVRGAISWRGQALRFAPLPLCLSRRASDETGPAIPSASTVQSIPVSRGVLVSRQLSASVVIPMDVTELFARTVRPAGVSERRAFSAVPRSQEGTEALRASAMH